MGLIHSPQIVTSGLVFAYDMANTKKSWKGKPTTNIIGNGCFAGGAGIENESGSYGNNNIVMLLNPGNTPYVLRQGPGGGEYEIHPKAGYAASLNANTTYCMSIWVAYTSDWNGNSLTLHSRWYDGAGNPYTTATDGTIFDTLNLGLVWQRRYTTFTTPSTVSGSYQWYLGYPTDNTTGFRYITGVQLEEGTFPTAFVDGTRSNTQALIDLTGNNTITANSLTYASDGTFSFNGTNDRLTSSTSLFNRTNGQEITVSCWIKPSRLGGQYSVFCTNRSSDAGTYNWIFYQHTNDGAISFHGSSQYKSTYIPVVNTWVNVTNTVTSAGVSTLYVNGVSTFVVNGYTYGGTPSLLGIGANPGGQESFQGSISNVNIYNRALSAAEVKQNFNALRGRYSI